MRSCTILAITLLASIACQSVAHAQSYELIDRNGAVRANIEIVRGHLALVESTGEHATFAREPRYDSPDGQLLGFYSAALRRALRFPKTGLGAMQVADLNQPNPRFQLSQRRVRPAEVDRGNPYVPSYGGGGFGSIYGTNSQSYPYVSGYPSSFPRSLLLDSKIVANPLLQPAKLRLSNSGPRELLVQVVDLKTRQNTQLKIPSGQSSQIEVQRDNGGKRIARYQSVGIAGDAAVKEVVTEIPPTVRYEIIVREWVLQSIAIDRTGKSPSVIEDANFQGKGLGRFTLPPGNQIRSGDVGCLSHGVVGWQSRRGGHDTGPGKAANRRRAVAAGASGSGTATRAVRIGCDSLLSLWALWESWTSKRPERDVRYVSASESFHWQPRWSRQLIENCKMRTAQCKSGSNLYSSPILHFSILIFHFSVPCPPRP